MEAVFAYDGVKLNEDIVGSPGAKDILGPSQKAGKPVAQDVVLQVQSVRNISIPEKDQEESNMKYDPKAHVLKFLLTDGFTTVPALLYSLHPELNDRTVPGTKIRVKEPISIVGGMLPLSKENICFLGGFVDHLVQDWKLQKAIQLDRGWGKSDNKGSGLGGEVPPPWRAFGQSLEMNKKELTTFKAMEAVRESKANSQGAGSDDAMNQFELNRKEAIAGLEKFVETKKSFAEGKQLMNKDILTITNEGFTEEEAQLTLRRFKNNRAAALKFLIERRDGSRPSRKKLPPKPNLLDDDSEPEVEVDPNHQPSSNITLFGFIKPNIQEEESDMDKIREDIRKLELREMSEKRGGFGVGTHKNSMDSEPDRKENLDYRKKPKSTRGGRGGTGRGNRGRRGEDGRFGSSTTTPERQTYEPYRGRTTDFPAMGEEESLTTERRNVGNNPGQRGSQQMRGPRPTVIHYAAHSEPRRDERRDTESRRTYQPVQQGDRERQYRENATRRDEPSSFRPPFGASNTTSRSAGPFNYPFSSETTASSFTGNSGFGSEPRHSRASFQSPVWENQQQSSHRYGPTSIPSQNTRSELPVRDLFSIPPFGDTNTRASSIWSPNATTSWDTAGNNAAPRSAFPGQTWANGDVSRPYSTHGQGSSSRQQNLPNFNYGGGDNVNVYRRQN